MSYLSEQILLLATRAGSECNSLHLKVGELTDLQTTVQDSTVAAINEVVDSVSTVSTTVEAITTAIEVDTDLVTAFETALNGG